MSASTRTRTRGANRVLAALSVADAPATVSYGALPEPGAYTGWCGRERVTLGANGTLPVPAHGYRVLVR